MGDQVPCRLAFGDAESAGTAHLESAELVFRGTFRLTIPFSGVSAATAEAGGDRLRVVFPRGTALFSGLGSRASRWAEAITHPKPVIDKLGVKPGMRVAVVGVDDPAFLAQLAARACEVRRGLPRAAAPAWDLIFLSASGRADLKRIPALQRRLRPDGALWVLRPKGSPALGEVEVLVAGRDAGLVDTKVVAFSAALSAAKFVIPPVARAGRAPAAG